MSANNDKRYESPIKPGEERFSIASQIEQCVLDGRHKRYGTSNDQSELTAGNEWWLTVVRLLRETPIEKLAALMVKNDGMDVDICSPGNHGGRGADADRWLVTLMPADHNNIREFFGGTLSEAIRQATL